jgi:uncharacterized protein with PIN domain
VPARPRWLADEMVGRLARYLRFLGFDTEYARGVSDDEIVERARREDRIVLTRDRKLASRVPGSVLLASPYLVDQIRTVRDASPAEPFEVRFDRCTLCNGRLARWKGAAADAPSNLPRNRFDEGLEIFVCERCGHYYWEGSHTRSVRQRLRSWLAPQRQASP